jgi:hypothetical protein
MCVNGRSFMEHVSELHERARQDFLTLLDETNKETMAISASTTVADWPKIERLVRVRTHSHTLVGFALHVVTRCADGVFYAYCVRVRAQGDKRYRTFSVRPEERVRLLEAYIAGDRPRTAEDKRNNTSA